MSLFVGTDQPVRCAAGSLAFVPKGVPHTYRVESSEPARWLGICSPGDFAAFVLAASRPAESAKLPPAPSGPPTDDEVAAITTLASERGGSSVVSTSAIRLLLVGSHPGNSSSKPRSRTPIAGLFLAGTSTAWGPATEGSMLSGLHAAGAITGRDLQAEIRNGAIIADRSRLAAWGADFDPLAACRRLGRRPASADEDATEEELAAAPLPIGAAM